MITVTVNLENEQVLQDDVRGLFAALTTEQVQDIAGKALIKYLTDSVDYEKKVYLDNAIEESREKGIPNSRSYYAKSAEDLLGLSDDAIMYTDAFKEKYLKGYKSKKESRFEEINKLIDEVVREKGKEFVTENEQLTSLVADKQDKIAADFDGIVKEMMLKVLSSLLVGTVNKAQMGYDNSMNLTTIVNDIATRQQY